MEQRQWHAKVVAARDQELLAFRELSMISRVKLRAPHAVAAVEHGQLLPGQPSAAAQLSCWPIGDCLGDLAARGISPAVRAGRLA